MDFFFPVAAVLVVLLIPVALIVGIVLVVRRARDTEPVPGIGTTRRLFLYWLAFISLMLAASGLTMLVASTLEQLFETSFGRGGSSDQAAFGLAATIVGFPIWLLLMRAGPKSLATYPGEAGSLGRKFYAYSVLLISANVVAYTATQTLSGLFSFDDLGASDFAAPLVWAAVWYYHWRAESIEGQPSLVAVALRKVYLYLTAAYGLIMLAAGGAFLLHGVLNNAYASLFRNNLLIDPKFSDIWNNEVRMATALAIVGGAWWWFHWHRGASGDRTSEIRLAAVYVLGIFGGLVVTVSGISIAVFTTLVWFIDTESDSSAANRFESLPTAIAVTVAGVGLWIYHRRLSQQDSAEDAQRAESGERVYRYLAAAVGLATLAVGVSLLIGRIVALIVDASTSSVIGSFNDASPTAGALTAILVGAPLWVRYWLQRQAFIVAADARAHEITTLSRRAYMFSVFGVAILATLIAASAVLFRILLATFDGHLRPQVFFDSQWGIGIVAAAALIAAYHWQVMKEDRALEPESESASAPVPAAPPKRITAVASSAARATANQIASQANATVTHWERRDDVGAPQLTAEQASDLADAVSNAAGEHVLLIADASGVQIIPL
jgi:hypothetical protein